METSLIPLESVNALELFTGGNSLDDLLARIRQETATIVPDVSTDKGRKEIASLAYKVARSKTTIDDAGKTLVAEWKAKSAQVDASRKKARDYLDALKDEVRKPLDEWEAEQERIKQEAIEAERKAIKQAEAERRAEQERIDRERREREEAAHRERLEAEALQRAEIEAEERRNREFQEAESRRVREAEEQARREEEARQREAEEQRLQAERERLAEEQRQFEARQADQRRKDEEAREQAEAERRANLTLRGAAQAVVEHFHGHGIAVVDDLAAALAKDEAHTGGKRQAAPVTRTPRRAVGE